jgi:hypothetical protein
MSTTNPCKYMINQQLLKTGYFYFLGKNYQAKNRDFIPFCLKKRGVYPIYGLFLELFSRFQKGLGWKPTAILGGLHG